MRTLRHISFIITLSFVMVLCLSSPVFAQDNNQKSASELASEITKLQTEIDNLGKDLSNLNTKSDELNKRIKENEESLKIKSAELEVSKNDMGGRARAMYIYGNDSYLDVLFSSKSMGELIQNYQNVLSVVQTDANSIKTIQKEQNEITSQINQLVKDKKEVEKNKEETIAKQKELQDKLKQQQGNLTSYGTLTGGHTTNSSGDRDMICAIVASEGNSTYDSALAVITCVMNRCDTGAWGGKDPISVLTAPGQFAGYLDGPYTRYLNHGYPAHVEQAVSDCLDKGIRNHNCLGFRSYPGWSGGQEINIGGNYYGNPMN